MNNKVANNPKLTDYLSILYNWKKFLIINFIIVAIISIIISFIIPVTYKSTATVMIPPSKDLGLGGLTNLLSSGTSALGMGAKLLGVTNSNEDLLLGFLNSKSILKKVIKKYDLFEYYGIDEGEYDRLLDVFKGDLMFDPNEFGMIDISVVNKDPNVSADMANYFVGITDSINIHFNVEQARRYREFIEKKFLSIQDEIRIAEEEYYKFQKEFGVFDVPEQMKVGITAIFGLKSELIQKEILLNSLKGTVSKNSTFYLEIMNQINSLQSKINELYEGENDSGVLLPVKNLPELQLSYVRLFRELEIQNKILEYIYPVYEQAKLDEQKSIPTLIIVDKAVPPQLKYAPKRAFIVIAITFISFVFMLIIIFRTERLNDMFDQLNLIEKKEKAIYQKIIAFYKLRFNK